MKSQLFKTEIPSDILYDFLKEFADYKSTYYLFSNVSFQKAKYHCAIEAFCNKIKPYYYKSKEKYIIRKMNYNNFTTIIRQICKANLITYTSKVKYEKSSYDIEHYIYI